MPAISVWSLAVPGLKSLVYAVFDNNAVTPMRYPFAGMARSYRWCPLGLLEGSEFFAPGGRSYRWVRLVGGVLPQACSRMASSRLAGTAARTPPRTTVRSPVGAGHARDQRLDPRRTWFEIVGFFVLGDNAVMTICKPFAGSKKYSGC